MRYKLSLNPLIKNNFIKLPLNSPLAQTNTTDNMVCLPIRIEDGQANVFYLGWAGGFSENSNTLEISKDLG